MNKLLRAKADIQAKRVDVGPRTRWMTPIWRRFESVGGFVVVIAVWQLAQQASGLPSTLFPSSLDALHALAPSKGTLRLSNADNLTRRIRSLGRFSSRRPRSAATRCFSMPMPEDPHTTPTVIAGA